MAKSFKEIGKKAEDLIEQGKEADKKVQSCQAGVAASYSRVVAARRQLAAVSETDEEGNPVGNVAQARAQLSVAENLLAVSQRALSSARGNADRVRQQKNTHVQEIERHNQVERSNLEKLRRLHSGAFGENSVALTEGIAQRLNEAEDARVELLRSMGIDAAPNYVAVGGEGTAGVGWRGGGFSAIDTYGENRSYKGGETAADLASKGLRPPSGGGLGDLLSRLFNGGDEEKNVNGAAFSNAPIAGNIRYTDITELSDDLYKYANDYVENSGKYNQPLRAHETTAEIEHFRELINAHQMSEDSIFYRRASLADLGSKFTGMLPEELVGRCYQFEGIMSVAKSYGFAGSKNNGNDATFEIHVPSGMHGLDLTQVDWFRQAMFDSPFCYIESVKKEEGSNATHFVVRILSAGNELNRANDFNALQKYMDSRYSMKLDTSIEKLSFDTVKSAIGGVESIIRDYPEVGLLLKSGITSNFGVMSCTGSKLSFNPNYFADDKRLHSACKNMSKSGFWISNASVTSIGVHEAAHGIEWALIQANPQYMSEQEKIEAWKKCSEAKKIVLEACANVKNTEYGRGKSSENLIRSISEYAMHSDSETMSEAFGDVYANGDNANPLSKEIKRLTRLLMNRYKGGI